VNRALWSGGLAAAALALAAAFARGAGRGSEGAGRPVVRRILGPFASVASGLQWIRVDVASRSGDFARAYARAETALDLDPESPAGWIFLAHHLVFERGSISREPDPTARARWIQAGIATLERGERASREPGDVFFEHGVALAFLGSLTDEDRAWPESAASAWDLAARAFEAAAARGTPRAERAAELARERAAALRR